MKKLKALFDELKPFADEQVRLDRMEFTANRELDEAASEGPLDNEKIQRKIADARIKLDIVARRKGIVQRKIAELQGAIGEEYRHLRAKWNAQVKQRDEELRQQILDANRPFFCGKERLLKSSFETMFFPIIEENRLLGWAGFSSPGKAPKLEDIAAEARHFMNQVSGCAEILTLPDEN